MSEDTKTCPYCGEQISINATKCKHCKEDLIEQNQTRKLEVKAKETVQILPRMKDCYIKINHAIKPIWIKLNLIFARFLAVAMIVGLIWGRDYISHLNTEWLNYPTICGIFCICICLTVVVIVLNVIATIIVCKYTDRH